MEQNIVNSNNFSEEQISFIKSFSKKEWLLNGWQTENPTLILNVFNTIALFIKDGNYLELGCGSGILSRFLFLFSGKKIIPYGVDINLEAIKLAKKNNPKFANNFRNEDYLEFLKSNTSDLNKFSIINIFVNFGEYNWNKLREVLIPLVRDYKKINFLICDYEDDFIPVKVQHIAKFISEMRKITAVSIACHSILVVGGDKKMHKIAKGLRKNVLAHLKDEKDKTLDKKKLEGFIIKKNSSFFYLIKENKFEQKRTKKLKFFLSPKCRFTEINYLHTREIVSERVINWQKIRKGDRVILIVGRDKQKNIVFGVAKLNEKKDSID